MYRVPRATYRVQFNAGFTFRDARAIAPYLAELGISDIYASPILKARKGSTHGYDVVDASALNPELGNEDDFTALHEELRRLGMGLLLDIVPNHMAASAENAWWMSVLENGPQSRFRHYFFKPDESPEKVLHPRPPLTATRCGRRTSPSAPTPTPSSSPTTPAPCRWRRLRIASCCSAA